MSLRVREIVWRNSATAGFLFSFFVGSSFDRDRKGKGMATALGRHGLVAWVVAVAVAAPCAVLAPLPHR